MAQPQKRSEGGLVGNEATRFKPGNNANPGGRPKGLARAVRDVAPPDKLASFFVAIFLASTDEELLTDELRAILGTSKVTLRDRIAAGEWLTERGYGKAPSHSPVEGEDPLELDVVATEIAGLVDELAARRKADAASDATPRKVEARSTPGTTPA